MYCDLLQQPYEINAGGFTYKNISKKARELFYQLTEEK
jgi:hypothetical protein